MIHKDVKSKFEKLFPLFAGGVTEWFPNGKNSIRVRIGVLHQDFVFTFNDGDDWKFETIDSFLKNLNSK